MSLRRLLNTTNRRIRNLVTRSVVALSYASGKIQLLQVTALNGEVLDQVEHFEPQGFTSRPKKGAEAILLCPGGNRSSAIAIVVGNRTIRVKDLGEGETAVYDDFNNLIHLKQDGTIAVKSDNSVDFDVPELTTTGNIAATGNISAGGSISAGGDVSDANGSMQEMRDVFNAHVHTGNQGNPTSAPTSQMT